ncbi:hypothetical protein ABZ509_36100, partial [Streptomyces lavendulocolor]
MLPAYTWYTAASEVTSAFCRHAHRETSQTRPTSTAPVRAVLHMSGDVPPKAAGIGVQPQGEAAKGGYATVNFKVPNERDNASTV